MTNKQLRNLCKVWQKRLRLQNWNINIRFAASQTEADQSFARGQMSNNLKEARIYICRPEDFDNSWLGSRDIEGTLIHELLHLHTTGFENLFEGNKLAEAALETAIESAALALLDLSRKRAK